MREEVGGAERSGHPDGAVFGRITRTSTARAREVVGRRNRLVHMSEGCGRPRVFEVCHARW